MAKKTPTKKTPPKKEPPKELPKPPGYPKPEAELKFSVITEVQQWGAGDNRAAPPNKGNKEAPRGPSDCLDGVTIVISGVLDSLERDEAEDYIKVGERLGEARNKTLVTRPFHLCIFVFFFFFSARRKVHTPKIRSDE